MPVVLVPVPVPSANLHCSAYCPIGPNAPKSVGHPWMLARPQSAGHCPHNPPLPNPLQANHKLLKKLKPKGFKEGKDTNQRQTLNGKN
jgi:hypothetical protein